MNGGSDTFIQRMTVLSPLMNAIGQCGFSVHKFEYSPDLMGGFVFISDPKEEVQLIGTRLNASMVETHS